MRNRARIGMAILVTLAGTAMACLPTRGDAENRRQLSELVEALDAAIPGIMQQANTPGLAIVLIRERKIVWESGYGVRVAGSAEFVSTRTVFEAGSMSKPLFAFAALRLVDAGKLDLDRPLDSYLAAPYLPDQPAASQITARMVLLHTSGLPSGRLLRDSTEPIRLQFAPGTGFLYSSEGFHLLQRVVERIVGENLATYTDREIMRPLGMSRSSYRWRQEFADELAAGHDTSGEPTTHRKLHHRPDAARSLYTTANDFARFLIEILGPSTLATPMSDAMREAMTTVQWRSYSNKSIRSLGWRIDPISGYVHHSGATRGGFRCFSRFHPQLGSGLVIMINGEDGQKAREPILGVITENAGDANYSAAVVLVRRIIERL